MQRSNNESSLRRLSNLEKRIIDYTSMLLQDVAEIKSNVMMLEAGMEMDGILEDGLIFLDRSPELSEHLRELEMESLDQENGSRKLAMLSGRRPPSTSSTRTLVVATDGSILKKGSRSGGGSSVIFSERSLLNRSEEIWYPSSSSYCEVLAIYLAASSVASSLPNVSKLLIVTDSEAAIAACKQLAMRGPLLVYPVNVPADVVRDVSGIQRMLHNIFGLLDNFSSIQIMWQKAHSHGASLSARINDLADREAKNAASRCLVKLGRMRGLPILNPAPADPVMVEPSQHAPPHGQELPLVETDDQAGQANPPPPPNDLICQPLPSFNSVFRAEAGPSREWEAVRRRAPARVPARPNPSPRRPQGPPGPPGPPTPVRGHENNENPEAMIEPIVSSAGRSIINAE